MLWIDQSDQSVFFRICLKAISITCNRRFKLWKDGVQATLEFQSIWSYSENEDEDIDKTVMHALSYTGNLILVKVIHGKMYTMGC